MHIRKPFRGYHGAADTRLVILATDVNEGITKCVLTARHQRAGQNTVR